MKERIASAESGAAPHVAGEGDAPGNRYAWVARVKNVLMGLSLALLSVVVMTRKPLVEEELSNAAVNLDPAYRGLAVGSALVFMLLGYALLITILFAGASLIDRSLSRLWVRPGGAPLLLFRLAVSATVVGLLTGDILMPEHGAGVGPPAAVLVLPVLSSVTAYLMVRGQWCSLSVRGGVITALGVPLISGVACSVW